MRYQKTKHRGERAALIALALVLASAVHASEIFLNGNPQLLPTAGGGFKGNSFPGEINCSVDGCNPTDPAVHGPTKEELYQEGEEQERAKGLGVHRSERHVRWRIGTLQNQARSGVGLV
jgi:hypothetical protein